MKWNYNLPLTMIAGFALILPISAFADDQNNDHNKQDKNKEKSSQHADKAGQKGAADSQAQSSGKSQGGNFHNRGRVNNASSGQGHVSHVSTGPATVQQSIASPTTSQNVQSGKRHEGTQQYQTQVNTSQQRNQTQVYSKQQRNQNRVYSNQQRSQVQVTSNRQYNRSNNYGGFWFAANTHSDWNRNQQYYWNNHNYRWYENGWLIIDGGFNPYYSNTVYSNSGSIVRNVQIELSEQGYYRGPIDGDIGPGTRNAIANYQSDYGLRVTGRINDPLLRSLRLE